MSGGRFANLEFDDKNEQPESAAPPWESDTKHANEIRDAQYYMERAIERELAGDHNKALRSYSAALGENPLLLDAWVGQLLMLLELAEFREANLWADKALEKFPDTPRLLAAKSVALFRMGRQRDGRKLNDAAIMGKGESWLVWLCRGELMLADSRSAAEDCFQHAVRLSERPDITQLRIGGVCYRYKKYHMAFSMLQEASSTLVSSALLWYLMGKTQEGLGLLSQALVSFRQAVELAPANEKYRRALQGEGQSTAGWITGLFRRWWST
ncbi:hypothetical protein ACFL01_00800 [Planctomycetota bacterium]